MGGNAHNDSQEQIDQELDNGLGGLGSELGELEDNDNNFGNGMKSRKESINEHIEFTKERKGTF